MGQTRVGSVKWIGIEVSLEQIKLNAPKYYWGKNKNKGGLPQSIGRYKWRPCKTFGPLVEKIENLTLHALRGYDWSSCDLAPR